MKSTQNKKFVLSTDYHYLCARKFAISGRDKQPAYIASIVNRGVVIRISGEGEKKRFTVRKMSDNIGVERIFPIESPFIDSITINKYGKVRRAKLYYLRKLTGKKARIKERRIVKKD